MSAFYEAAKRYVTYRMIRHFAANGVHDDDSAYPSGFEYDLIRVPRTLGTSSLTTGLPQLLQDLDYTYANLARWNSVSARLWDEFITLIISVPKTTIMASYELASVTKANLDAALAIITTSHIIWTLTPAQWKDDTMVALDDVRLQSTIHFLYVKIRQAASEEDLDPSTRSITTGKLIDNSITQELRKL